MTTFRVLKQYLEDLEAGLAMRFDNLDTRLDAIESDLAAIKVRMDEHSVVDPHVVASHTGLTLAQSRVAVMLAEGNTVRDIVLKTGAKENSVRAHIKRIHSKLGVSTQAQVVRVVLTLPHGMGARGRCQFCNDRNEDASASDNTSRIHV